MPYQKVKTGAFFLSCASPHGSYTYARPLYPNNPNFLWTNTVIRVSTQP